MRDLNDGGGIYLLGKQPGTQVKYNIIRDISFTKNHSSKQYLFGIYLDHAEGITVWNNLVSRMADSGIILFDMHWKEPAPIYANKNNIIEKNIFADSGIKQTHLESHNYDTFRNNVIYYTKNQSNRLFYKNETGIIKTSDNNLFYGVNMPGSYPVYRFWNRQNDDHFYTADEAEKNKLINLYSAVFQYEGVVFRMFKEQKPGTVPLYRFVKTDNTHFYTANESEKNKLINSYAYVYTYEKVAGYVYPGNIERPNALPVYRFFNRQNSSHFYTSSESEKIKLETYYAATYMYEGVVFYVCENAAFDTSSQLQTWKATTGLDASSKVENPNFYDYAADDFRLFPGSPAIPLGFQEIIGAGPRE